MSEYRIQCTNPACGKTLRVPDTALGRRVRCPSCKQEIRAPGSIDEQGALAARERFRLHVLRGPAFAGTEISLDPDRPYTFGRADTCTFQLPGPTVSRRHFSLHWVNGHWILEDLNTTTGTLVNGLTVVNKELAGNELIGVGSYELKLVAPGRRVDSERGRTQVVVPAAEAAPLPLHQDAPTAPEPQKEDERLAQQRLIEAISYTDYSPEHLSQVSSTEHRAYTFGLVLRLAGLIVGSAALLFGLAWFGKHAVGWYGDASRHRPALTDSNNARTAPVPELPTEYLTALEAKDFELARKLLDTDAHDPPLQKAMDARLQGDISAFRAELLRQARAAVPAENWNEVERRLAQAQAPALGALPADWKPIQDALALQQIITTVKDAIAQRHWEDAAKGLATAKELAPSDRRLGPLAKSLADALGAGLRVNLTTAVDGARIMLNGTPIATERDIWELPLGAASLEVSAPGFISHTESLSLEGGKLLPVDVKLLRTPPAPVWALRCLEQARLAEPLWVAALHYNDADAVDDAVAARFANEAAHNLTREPGRSTIRVARITLKTGETFAARVWTDSSGRLGINRLPTGDSEVLSADDVKTTQDLELKDAAQEVFQGILAARRAGLSPLEALKLVAKFRADLGSANQPLAAQICRDLVAECLQTIERSCGCCAGSTRIACHKCDGTGFVVQSSTCDRCKGTHQMACTECSGHGHLPCRACGGKGTVEEMHRSRETCMNCGGHGSVRQLGGAYVQCPRCGGGGHVYVDRPVNKKCPACDGNATVACMRCKTTGKIECTKCKGTGRVDERSRCPDCEKGAILCDCCQGVGTRDAMPEARRRELERAAAEASN